MFYEKPKPWCPVSPAFSETAWSPGELMFFDYLTAERLSPRLLLQWQGTSNPGNMRSQVKASDWPLQWWMVKGSQKMVPLVMLSSMFSLFRTFFYPNTKRELVSAVTMIWPPETGTREERNYVYGFRIRNLGFPFHLNCHISIWRNLEVKCGFLKKTVIYCCFFLSREFYLLH